MKIVYERSGKKEDITKFVTQVQWSGSANEVSRTLEFALLNSPYDKSMSPPILAKGDIIYFYNDNKLLFYGHVLVRERIGELGELNYTARDLMNNMIKSKISKKFKNKTPEYIAKACAKAAGISVGKLYKTKTKIKKQYATDESCYNIMMNAYAKASKKKHVQFIPRMRGKLFEVVKKGRIVTTLSQDADIIALRINESADDMVNSVNIYNKKGKRTGRVRKASWVRTFGLYQATYTKEKKSSGKKQAKAMLKGAKKEMEVEAIGNIKCIAGAGVYIYDPVSGITGNFWIESDNHTFSNGVHKMSLQLTFKNKTERPDVNYDSGSSSKNSSGRKTVSTGVMIGTKVKGLRFTAYVKGEGGPVDMRGRTLNPADKTVAFDYAVHKYGSKAYGMKMQIFGTHTRYDKKIMTIRDTGTGNNHTVDILMTRSQMNRWNNPHGYVILARRVRYKTKTVSSGDVEAGSKQDKVVRYAKKWVGKVKYVYGANNVPGGRSDCSAFTQFVFRKATGKSIGRTTKDQVKKGRKISKVSQLKPGDLILFNTVGWCSHVGIYIGKGKFIHCGCSHGVAIENIKSGYYRRKFLMGRRVL